MFRRALTAVPLCILTAVSFAVAQDRTAGPEGSASAKYTERSNIYQAQLATADKYRTKAAPAKAASKPGKPYPKAVPANGTLREEMSNSVVLGGGYNYQRVEDMPVDRVQGVFVGGFYYPRAWIGIGGEYQYGRGSGDSGNRHDRLTRHVGVFGPELSGYPGDNVRLFVHPLFGWAKERMETRIGNSTVTSDETNFAMQIGGGMDIRFTKTIAWRVFQLDYLGIKHPSTWQNNWRLTTGIAVRAH
ncbi:MAG: hypothetical protein JO314_14015 [Acidobacteria bacterium]|nr:hypothetical protein [Acidobacteriota bacterium]